MTRAERRRQEALTRRTLARTGYDRLVEKHGRGGYRAPLPDLSVGPRAPSLGDGFGRVPGKRSAPEGARQFPVGHFHKQGFQLVSEQDLEWAGGKKS